MRKIEKLILAVVLVAASTFGALAQSLAESAYERLSEREQLMVQVNLKSLGYYSADVDGIWGPSMESAIAAVIQQASQTGQFYDASDPTSMRSLFNEILNSGDGEGWECDGCAAVAPPSEANSGLPDWLNVPSLSFDASVQDWVQASEPTRLASAAQYFASYISSDAQLRNLLSSGELRQTSQRIMQCMNEIIVFGAQTGQKTGRDPVYPDIAGGCLFIVQSN